MVAILKSKMAAIREAITRGPRSENLCIVLLLPCAKLHAFKGKCTIDPFIGA